MRSLKSLIAVSSFIFIACAEYAPYPNTNSSSIFPTSYKYKPTGSPKANYTSSVYGNNDDDDCVTYVTEIVSATVTTCQAGETVTVNGQTSVVPNPQVVTIYTTLTKTATIYPKHTGGPIPNNGGSPSSQPGYGGQSGSGTAASGSKSGGGNLWSGTFSGSGGSASGPGNPASSPGIVNNSPWLHGGKTPLLSDLIGDGTCYPPGNNPGTGGPYLPGKNPPSSPGGVKTVTSVIGNKTLTSTVYSTYSSSKPSVSSVKTPSNISSSSVNYSKPYSSTSLSKSATITGSSGHSSGSSSGSGTSSHSNPSGSVSTSKPVFPSSSASSVVSPISTSRPSNTTSISSSSARSSLPSSVLSSFKSSATSSASSSSTRSVVSSVISLSTSSSTKSSISSSASSSIVISASRSSSSSSSSSSSASASATACSFWLENMNHQGLAAFNSKPGSYQVFRNVKDFGAVGDGVTDDTDAINAAISSGGRCAPGSCASSTTSPATVRLIIPYSHLDIPNSWRIFLRQGFFVSRLKI
jgi:hypothetical protein